MNRVSPDYSAPYHLVVTALGLLALLLLAHPFVRAFGLAEVNYNEGWNAVWQLRAASGDRLYSGQPLLFNNYPPLSFHLIAALSALTHDVVLTGRLVSLVALAMIAGACAFIVRGNGGGRADAALAAICFVLPLLVFYESYVGSNDPQLLGMAFAAWGFALHLTGARSPARAALSATLLALAVLTKHNLVAALAVVAADTLLRGSGQCRAAFFGIGLGVATLAAVLLLQSEGAAFYTQLLAPREWHWGRALDLTSEMLLRHQSGLLLALTGLWFLRSTPGWTVLFYIAVATALGAGFSGGAGTAENIWFDLLAGLAIAAGLIAARLRQIPRGSALAVAAALAACAAPMIGAPAAFRLDAEGLRGGLARDDSAFVADATFLATQPGPVLCESLLLCLRAGKAPLVDPFNSYQAGITRRTAGDAVTTLLTQRRFAVVQIRSPRGGEGDRFRNFAPTVYDRLDSDYRLVRTAAMGRFWVPR
jgi:hypothetical protein